MRYSEGQMYTYLNFTLSFFYIYSHQYSSYSKYKHNAIPFLSMSVCTTGQASSHVTVCLSACIRGTPTHWISWSTFGSYIKKNQYIPNLVKIGQKQCVTTYIHSQSLIKTGLHISDRLCSLWGMCWGRQTT